MITGVDVLIDDTPNTIILSSFNLYRRAIALNTINLLIEDGRIHPARIEEIYKKCENDTHEKVCEWIDYKKEFDNYIASTCRPGEKRLDIYEKLYITLIKEAFKRYEEYLESERMKQARLEELENWDGVIE